MAEKVEQSADTETDDGKDKPGLRQRLHWATDDREAEAKALADRAGEEVDEEAAKLAVHRAHGEVRDGVEPEKEDDIATADDAKVAAEDASRALARLHKRFLCFVARSTGNRRPRDKPGRMPKEKTMDVTKVLEADHRQVEDLFAKLEKAEGKKRQPFIDELVKSLQAHMKLEEEVVYPVMEPVTGKEDVQEANTEHELGRKGLEDVVRLSPDEPGFDGALESVKAGISHHVEEEEKEIFPKLRKDGVKVLEEMATPFMKKRLELGLPMGADALAAASSKDELLAEAKSAGVDGASSMTKAQLADALAEVMA